MVTQLVNQARSEILPKVDTKVTILPIALLTLLVQQFSRTTLFADRSNCRKMTYNMFIVDLSHFPFQNKDTRYDVIDTTHKFGWL